MQKLSVPLLALLTVGTACGVFGTGDDESPAPAPTTTPTDTGTSGGNGPPPPPPPPVDGKPITGVFVSSSLGADTNDGVVSRPMKTLGAAMKKAKESNQAVIACAEAFNEALVLINGVTLYGYFDCGAPDWKRAPKHAIVNSPTSPAVLADKLDLQARIEGFDFIAPDIGGKAAADKVARSSIGMVVKQSKGLEISDVFIRGGNAEAGADGAENADVNVGTGPAVPAPSAQYNDCFYGPVDCNTIDHGTAITPPSSQTCKYGAPGGPGGQGGDCVMHVDGVRRAQSHNYDGLPVVANASTAMGGLASVGYAVTTEGSNGVKGATGNPGNNGAWSYNVENGFVPGDGSPGLIGGPGQGGGGGAGNNSWRTPTGGAIGPPMTGYAFAGTGGSGGAGGCGGLPGTAGHGGGASIGLVVIESNVTVKSSFIIAQAGGAAGKGALGQAGTAGLGPTFPFPADDRRYGGIGGYGGAGGDAGPSGHGSAGPSIAFAFKGARPNVDATTTLTPGAPGGGQSALTRNDKTVPAVAGEAKPEHGF